MKSLVYITNQETPILSFSQGQPTHTGLTLRPPDLVEIDPEFTKNVAGVCYYRLTPTSSSTIDWWIVVGTHNLQLAETVFPVTSPRLMYVDNFPHGQFLLFQPIDRPDFIQPNEPVALVPFEKVSIQYDVVHPHTGVTFYYIQHQGVDQSVRLGWLPDRRRRLPTEEDPHDDVTLLLHPELVSVGRFAFSVRQTVELRLLPDVGQASRTGRFVLAGDVVVASVIRHSPYKYGNGPFLLLDSQFWLCQQSREDRTSALVPLDIEEGMWTLQVRATAVAGLAVLRQPCREFIIHPNSDRSNVNPAAGQVDSIGSLSALHWLQRNELVVCGARFESPNSGVWFYHVVRDAPSSLHSSSVGWIADRTVTGDRKRVLLVQVCTDPIVSDAALGSPTRHPVTIPCNSDSPPDPSPDRSGSGPKGSDRWTVEYVRDLSVAGSGSEQIQLSETEPDRDAITFAHQTSDGESSLLVHVQCKTQNVIIEQLSTHQRKLIPSCTAPQLAMILQDPSKVLQYDIFPTPSIATSPPSYRVVWEDEVPVSEDSPNNLRAPSTGSSESELARLSNHTVSSPTRPANGHSRNSSMAASTDDASETDQTQLAILTISSPTRPLNGDSRHNLPVASRDHASETNLAPLSTVPGSSPTRLSNGDSRNNLPVASNDDASEENRTLLSTLSISAPVRPSNGTLDHFVGAATPGEESSVGEQMNRRCGVCDELFESARARSLHCLKEHSKYSCNYCLAVFSYSSELKRHRDERDHW